MAERDFYNINTRISYPLIHGDPVTLLPSGTFPREVLVDAGFVMGKDSGFLPETDSVYLYSVTVTYGDIILDFRSTASGFSDWHFSFLIPSGTPPGATAYEDATSISDTHPDHNYGTGFITVQDVSALLLLVPGTYTLEGVLRVEQGLIQTEVDSFVADVSLANKARCCPTPCGNQPSSSSSSAAQLCDPDGLYVLARELEGDVLFKEGYNVTIQVDEANNALLFDARLGYGAGESCEDVIIDDDGEDGFHRGEFCLSCDEVIRSVNGHTVPEGKLVLVGWPGVVIVPNQATFEVGITLDSEKFCEGA
jgi:hypothetical protein